MTQEDKDLLLRDLSARLPYGVIVNSTPIIDYSEEFIGEAAFCSIKREQLGLLTKYGELVVNLSCDIVKPYLRQMSSMTDEEYEEYAKLRQKISDKLKDWKCADLIDWLNKHHFDYRGLIEKGLAIEVTEENNPYEN